LSSGARAGSLVLLRLRPGLARFPPEWNHFGDKKSRQLNMLEHVLVGKVFALCRNML
jgi:hypothetical protein